MLYFLKPLFHSDFHQFTCNLVDIFFSETRRNRSPKGRDDMIILSNRLPIENSSTGNCVK
jgi:hypothetical protein